MSSKKKVVAIAVTTVALSLGSVGFASADNAKSHSKSKVSVRKITSINFGGLAMEAQDQGLAAILSGLVAKGTLTQAQVDAINAAITAARTSAETQGEASRTAELTLIATTIGINVPTLQTRLAAGDSLATIAGAKTTALITALVANGTVKIDAAVTAGRISAVQATAFKANLTAAVTAMVNRTGGPMDGPRGREGRHMGIHQNEGIGAGMGVGMGVGSMQTIRSVPTP